MKIIILSFVLSMSLVACTESERPAAQAKHALDSAQNAADQATQHAQDVAEQAKQALAD